MRILLVEDHKDTRQVLTRLLRHWGFEVTPAENLQTGLDRLGTEAIDVILSDIGLPDGTGHALISEARRQGKNMLAIALSGFGTPSEIQLAKMTGFDHHLSKPFDCQQLRLLLEKTIAPKPAVPQA
jgi:two-component system, chemotaxis family, CheB/CheR fusion protein